MFTFLTIALLGSTALVATVRADYPCCLCGPVISVGLRVQNILVEPFFNHSINIQMGQRQLLYFLQAAADKQEEFRFTARYYPDPLGYFITIINNRRAVKGSHWMITDKYDNTLTQGVSSYVPYNNDLLIFNFTKTGHN